MMDVQVVLLCQGLDYIITQSNIVEMILLSITYECFNQQNCKTICSYQQAEIFYLAGYIISTTCMQQRFNFLHTFVRRKTLLLFIINYQITRSLYTTWPEAGTLVARQALVDDDYTKDVTFREACEEADLQSLFLESRPLSNCMNYQAQTLGMPLYLQD